MIKQTDCTRKTRYNKRKTEWHGVLKISYVHTSGAQTRLSRAMDILLASAEGNCNHSNVSVDIESAETNTPEPHDGSKNIIQVNND